MYMFVQKRMQDQINKASNITITCDESTTVDNNSWLCLHVYVIENWARKPLLLILQKLDSYEYTFHSIVGVIIDILSHHGKTEAD